MGTAETLEGFLTDAGISFARAEGGTWNAMLVGERKVTIPVTLSISKGDLRIESFFMRAPMENRERFHEMLLRRNARAYGVAFAIDGIGDVYLVGSCPEAGVSEAELDRLFGGLLVEADGLFDAAIELGFASYLEADMAWRRAQPPAGG